VSEVNDEEIYAWNNIINGVTQLWKSNKNGKQREMKNYFDEKSLLFVLFRIIPKVKSDFRADEYAFGNSLWVNIFHYHIARMLTTLRHDKKKKTKNKCTLVKNDP
jgi:hypothetical protein